MQLVYFIDLFEDNHNIIDLFEIESVNVIKNRPLVAKKHKEICISTWLSHIRKQWKFSLGTTTLETFVCHTGLGQTVEKLYELEKYWC